MLLPAAPPEHHAVQHSAAVIMLPCTVTLYGARGGRVHDSLEQTVGVTVKVPHLERPRDPGHH